MNQEELKKIMEIAMLKDDNKEIEQELDSINEVIMMAKKVKELKLDNDEILISPINEDSSYDELEVVKISSKENILKNVSHRKDDYIVVPRVIE